MFQRGSGSEAPSDSVRKWTTSVVNALLATDMPTPSLGTSGFVLSIEWVFLERRITQEVGFYDGQSYYGIIDAQAAMASLVRPAMFSQSRCKITRVPLRASLGRVISFAQVLTQVSGSVPHVDGALTYSGSRADTNMH